MKKLLPNKKRGETMTAKNKPGEVFLETLQLLYDYCELEKRVANRQGDDALLYEDFCAADRHFAFAQAMQKVGGKLRALARERHLIALTRKEDAII